MFKKGFTSITLVVLVVGILLGGVSVFAYNQLKPKTPLQTESGLQGQLELPSAKVEAEKFDQAMILKSTPFVNSKGENKKFIVLKTGEEGGISRADAYITEEDLSVNSSVKILKLSDPDSGIGYAAAAVQGGGASLTVSVSPGSGTKFIVVEITIADGGSLFIVDEGGKLISDTVSSTALNLVKDKCQCGSNFDNWKDNDEFYVKVITAVGPTYRMTIDATSGQIIGNPAVI